MRSGYAVTATCPNCQDIRTVRAETDRPIDRRCRPCAADFRASNPNAYSTMHKSCDSAGQVPAGPDLPSHTVTGAGNAVWVHERPATTVISDPRIARPRRHDPTVSGSQKHDAIKVTATEAALLQGFPADHPWQGNKGQVHQQIGNAVPPPLARAVLSAVLDPRPSNGGDQMHLFGVTAVEL